MNLSESELEKLMKGNPDLSTETSPALGASQNRASPVAKRSKYGNLRTNYRGNVYDSKAEAGMAMVLDQAVATEDITFYLRQVNFPLPGGIIYKADFVTFKMHQFIATAHTVAGILWGIKVIEVKGFATKEWKLKEKLFRKTYPNLELEIRS